MVDDPYKVLGVQPGASQEEIKRAYRRKAKECHPDLHPDDPNADKRMNEVNEAYDMLMHPDKYAQRRAQQQAQQQYRNPYGYGGQSYGGQNYGSPYGQQGQQGGYRGAGGWSSDFGGFGFDDFFGFGGAGYGGSVQPPQEMPGDSPQIRQVIQEIRMGQYQAASMRLQNIPSTGRNARWYYLSGVANHGAGNTITAIEHMQRAVQMEPNNQLYHRLLNQYRQAGQTYESNARGFNMGAMDPSKICSTLCLMNLLCNYCPYCRMFFCC